MAGVEAGQAFIPVEADLTGFGRDLSRKVDRSTRPAAEKVRGSFLGAFKGIAAAAGGIFAAREIGQFFGSTIDEAREAGKVSRLTAQVIKTTGGAAKVSAGQVGTLSERLSNLAGVDDEVIQGGANLLLTFTKVRNEVGAGNNVFDRGAESALNMSAALGQDMKSSSLQVGKALNDPLKGVTALTRAGVSFTQQQRDQIKALIESGDVLGAQKIILGELETQFGGAAKAATDPMQRLGVVVGNLKERIGVALLPVVERVADWLGDNLPGALAFAERAFSSLREALAPIVKAAQMFFYTLRTGFTEDEGTPIERYALIVRNDLLPILRQVVEFVQRNLKPILIGLAAVFIALTSPMTAVVAAAVLLYARFQVVRDVVGAVVGFLVEQFASLRAWTLEVWPQIQEAVMHVVNALKAAWRLFGDDLLRVASAIWSQVQNVISTAVNTIRSVIQLVLALINGDWGRAWEALKSLVGGLLTGILDTIRNGLSALSGIFGGAFDAGRRAVVTAGGKIVDFVASLPGKILDALAALPGQLLEFGKEIARKVLEGIGDLADDIADKINPFSSGPGKHVGPLGGIIGPGANAAGTDFWRGGPTWVGERGPEIVNLPRGSQVIPNHEIGAAGGLHVENMTLIGPTPQAVVREWGREAAWLVRSGGIS